MKRTSLLTDRNLRRSGTLLTFAILAGFAAVLLNACMTDSDAQDPEYDKYKDTPVTQATAQASLAAQAEFMADWDANVQDSVAGGAIPGMGAGAEWPAMQKSAALQKAGADVFVVDSSTAAQGYGTFIATRGSLLATTYDTAIVRWDAQARDNVSNNENVMRWSHTVVWFNGGIVERAAFTDADGDGLVTVVAGRSNRVRIDFRKNWTRLDGKEQVETAVVVAEPGPDNDFDTEGDNRLYQAEWKRTVAGAATASVVFTDEDGDGRVLDNGAVSVVRLTAWESDPPFRPRVKGVRAVVRVRKPGYGLGEEPVGFEYTDTLRNGRIGKIYLRNSDGGDVIVANDTLRLFVETRQRANNDSLRSLDVEVAFSMGANLKSKNDDVFYSLKAEAHNRLGFHRDVKFAVISNAPVPRGQEPQSGSFSLEVTYANRKSVSLEGTFTPTAFDGVYTGPAGDTASVHINR
jgi:hypothetical protein